MRLRILRDLSGSVDGVDLSRFIKGFTYEVGSALGNLLLAEGWGEPVPALERHEPALVLPLSQFHPPRVLIIEDDDSARSLVAASLRHEGYNVVEARDGREGLTALVRHRPSLILLDLRMPRMDGREFRDAQRRLADRTLANVPVVVVSAVDDARVEGDHLGARDVVEKPVNLHHLIDVVEREAGSPRPF